MLLTDDHVDVEKTILKALVQLATMHNNRSGAVFGQAAQQALP